MNQEERDAILLNLMKGQEERDAILLDLKKGQEEMKYELRKLSLTVAKIEVEHGHKLEALFDALFDAFKMHSEKFDSTEKRLNSCEEKIEKHDSQIYYLKSKVQGL